MKRHAALGAAFLALLLGLSLALPLPARGYVGKQDLVREAQEQIVSVDVGAALLRLEGQTARFVDCREPEEFAQGHIPGAVNIPRGLLEFKIEALVPDRDAPMVVYCKSGGRSSLATCALQRMGYAGAASLTGGWKAWVAAGHPIEISAPASADAADPQAPADKQDLLAEARARINEIDVAVATVLHQQGRYRFLDCREPDEYAQGHVPSALNIPRGLLEFKIGALVPDRDAPLVVYCKSGGRGCLATDTLRRMGYAKAVNLQGGWKAWSKAGLPAEAAPGAALAQAGGIMTKKDLVRHARDCANCVSLDQARTMYEEGGHYFLDCREEREYRSGHIPRALNLPRGLLEFKIEQVVPQRDASIVVYCRSGDRSCMGVLTLARMGYVNAVSLEGGWKAWNEANYPVQ